MIQGTSLEIYLKKIYPALGQKQAVVLHYLQDVGPPRTNEEIRMALHVPINHVTGRVKELRDEGLVVDAGRRKENAR